MDLGEPAKGEVRERVGSEEDETASEPPSLLLKAMCRKGEGEETSELPVAGP